jgi:serine/threonine-protein kinase
MKCPKCQADNTDTARFCSNCAASLTSAEDAQPSFTKTLETPIQDLTRGTLFAGRYEIIEELGRGGMGSVYRIEDKKTSEDLASGFEMRRRPISGRGETGEKKEVL